MYLKADQRSEIKPSVISYAALRDSEGRIKPEYLSIADLSMYSGIGKTTLRELISAGLPYYQWGRKQFVKVSEFDDYMKRFRQINDIDSMIAELMGN